MDHIENTPNSRFHLTKAMKVFLVIAVMALLLIPVIIYVLSNQPSTTNYKVTYNSPESFPVSMEIEETPEEIIPVTPMEFVNAPNFEKTNYTSYNSENCSSPELEYPIDLDMYKFVLGPDSEIRQFDDRDVIEVSLLNNASTISYDNRIGSVFNITKAILDNSFNNTEITKIDFDQLFRIVCGGGSLPIVKVVEFDYPGTDVAYGVITAGSTQSTFGGSWVPLQLNFIFRKGDDYGHVSLYSNEYTDLASSYSLDRCHEDLYGTPVINDSQCLKEGFEQDFDQAKFEVVKNKVIEIFELKQ